MEFTAEDSMALMGIVTNPLQRSVEVVDVNRLRLVFFGINYAPGAAIGTEAGNLQVTFAWGGYDSLGRFQVDPRIRAGTRSINAENQDDRDIWRQAAFDASGNPLTEFGPAFFERLMLDLPQFGRSLLEWMVLASWPGPVTLSYPGRGRVLERTAASPELTGRWVAGQAVPGVASLPPAPPIVPPP